MRSHRFSILRRALVAGAALLAGLALAAPAQAEVAFGTGVTEVQGQPVIVEVFVTVPGTRSAEAAVKSALEQQSAVPVSEAAYGFTGLKWASVPVRQFYNPVDEPVDALSALRGAQAAWGDVPGSAFAIAEAGTTNRCPSLTRGCGTDQTYDHNNDVGWQRLARGTLGITWYSSERAEADVALTTRYPWAASCESADTGAYDVQTVLLHENGHVAGLDHSSDERAVMYASYQGARCGLGDDDRGAIAALYPRRPRGAEPAGQGADPTQR